MSESLLPFGFHTRQKLRMLKYGWWWKRTFYYPTRRAYHRIVWGIDGDFPMWAKTGRGKFVDVRRRGPYVEITEHTSGDMIRMIPYQPNHGYMVELHKEDGTMPWRTHLDFRALRGMGFDERSK